MTSRSEPSPERKEATPSASGPLPGSPGGRGSARFGRSRRLRRAREFTAVYRGRMSERVGPLVVYALPNELARARLGLSVPRRVGGAVARNRVKRLLREVFRHHQSDLPRGYDFVINVQAHAPLRRDEYEALLPAAMQRLHERWIKRDRRAESRRNASANVERPNHGA